MITIRHHKDVDGMAFQTVLFSEGRDYNMRASQYYTGWTKPNYPVPAIRYKTAFVPYVHPVWTGGKRIVALGIFNISKYPGMIAEKYWLQGKRLG